MKLRLLLGLFLAGLICSCTTTDNSTRTQQAAFAPAPPPAPLTPQVGVRH